MMPVPGRPVQHGVQLQGTLTGIVRR